MTAVVAGLTPVLVLSSDLRRATETAQVLVARTGADWETDPALREVWLGGWEGLDHAQVEARWPDEYRDWKAGLPIRRGGGETEAEAGARAARRVLEAADGVPNGATVVVVAHGLVIRAALGVLAADGVIVLDGDPPHLGNGEWATYPVVPAGRAHLPPPVS